MQTSEGNSSKYPIPTVRAKRRYSSTERLILSLEASQAFTERTFFASQDTPLPPLAPETRIGGVKGTEQRNRPMGGMARIPLAPNASRSKEHLGAEYLISIPHRPPTRTERHASLCARSLSRRAFATGNTQRYPIFLCTFFCHLNKKSYLRAENLRCHVAQVAELVDALVSGTSNSNVVQVRFLFWAREIL